MEDSNLDPPFTNNLSVTHLKSFVYSESVRNSVILDQKSLSIRLHLLSIIGRAYWMRFLGK